jgi:hypothetical protein
MDPSSTKQGAWKWPDTVHAKTRQQVAAILWELHLGGPAEENGRTQAPGALAERLRKRPGSPWKPARSPGNDGMSTRLRELALGTYGYPVAIRRTLSPTRCHRVELAIGPHQLPPCPFATVTRTAPAPTNGSAPPEPLRSPPERPPAPTATVPSTASEPPPGGPLAPPSTGHRDPVGRGEQEDERPSLFRLLLDIQGAAADGVMMLADLAGQEVVAARQGERLAEVQAENDRLRRRVDAAEETAVARQRENEALRRALTAVKANLQAVMKGQRVPDEHEHKVLAGLMAAKPGARA